MKRILAFLALAVFSLSLYAQDCTPPPIVGDVYPGDLEPHVDKVLKGIGNGEGSAKALLDDLDPVCHLRDGLIKYNLDGQVVYYEPYSWLSEVQGQRRDSSQAEDAYREGTFRKGGLRKVNEWKDAKSFETKTEAKEQGVNRTAHFFKSNQSTGAQPKDSVEMGAAGFSIWYAPMPIKVHPPKMVADVYEGGRGAIKLKVTDEKERWCLDGYTFKITVMNPETMAVEEQTVTTGPDGNATIKLDGLKKGNGRLRVYLYLADPESGAYVEVEEYFNIEVKEPEKWEYTLNIHDQFTLPAHDYTLTGDFSFISSLGDDDLPHFKMLELSKVNKSDGGSFDVMGDFITETSREDGVSLGFDINGILSRTRQTVGAHMDMAAEEFAYIMSGGMTGMQTMDSQNPVTGFLALLEEGTWSAKLNIYDLDKISGGMPAPTESEPTEEETQAPSKKKKKKSALRELRDAMKELDNLKNNPPEPQKPSDISEEQKAAAKAAQIAFLREHHGLVIPDLTQMLLPKFGNTYKELMKSGSNVDISWKEVRWTLTMKQEK